MIKFYKIDKCANIKLKNKLILKQLIQFYKNFFFKVRRDVSDVTFDSWQTVQFYSDVINKTEKNLMNFAGRDLTSRVSCDCLQNIYSNLFHQKTFIQ